MKDYKDVSLSSEDNSSEQQASDAAEEERKRAEAYAAWRKQCNASSVSKGIVSNSSQENAPGNDARTSDDPRVVTNKDTGGKWITDDQTGLIVPADQETHERFHDSKVPPSRHATRD